MYLEFLTKYFKRNIFLVVSSIVFVVQTALILFTNINIFPEIFYFSWLVHKGLIPNIDFFDDRGILFHLILSPLSTDKSLMLMKAFYVCLESVALLLIFLILKKYTTRLGLLLGIVIFVFLNFFLSENNLWFDNFIEVLYLATFYVFSFPKSRLCILLLAALIAFSSFVKPQAGILIIPILFLTKEWRIFLIFIFWWFVYLGWYSFHHGLSAFIDNVIFYNQFLSKYYRPIPFPDINWSIATWGLSVFFVFTNIVKGVSRKILPVVSFLLCSLAMLATGYNQTHLVVSASFFVILLSISIKEAPGFSKKLTILAAFLYLTFISVKAIKLSTRLNQNRTPYIENTRSRRIVNLLTKKYSGKRIYVFGEEPEIYYFLNQLPISYFPAMKYPYVENFYHDYEEQIIDGIKKNGVEIIVIPQPVDLSYQHLSKIKHFIQFNSFPVFSDQEVQILSVN